MTTRSVLLRVSVLAGLLVVTPLTAQQSNRSFVDFSNPEFTVRFALSTYSDFDEQDFVGNSALGGGAASLFNGHPVCTGDGGLDAVELSGMFGGVGASGSYHRAGGWPWDTPLGANGGAGGGAAAGPPVLALTHGTAIAGTLLVRPTWWFPGLQGERVAWNVVGGIGLHKQTDGDPAPQGQGPQGLAAWGIQGQTNLTYNIAVTTELALNDNLGVQLMARMNWLQRDDVVFLQSGGGTVTAPGETLSWGHIGLGLTWHPRGR